MEGFFLLCSQGLLHFIFINLKYGVFSGDLFNTHTPLIIGLPLSTKIKNYRGNLILEPDPENGLKQKSEVFTFHIRSIAKERLSEKIGRIDDRKLKELRKYLQEILTY